MLQFLIFLFFLNTAEAKPPIIWGCSLGAELLTEGLCDNSGNPIGLLTGTTIDDNAVVRGADGNKAIQGSGVLIDDNDDITIPGSTTWTLGASDGLIVDGETTANTNLNGLLDLKMLAGADGTAALDIEMNINNFSNVFGIELDYIATGAAPGDTDAAIEVNIDRADSTGGEVAGIIITTSGTGSASVNAIELGPEVGFILQESGAFGNVEVAFYDNSGFTDVTAAFNSVSTDVALWETDNSVVYIGNAATFGSVEFVLATTASGAGIKPIFEYSAGASSWTTFNPLDATLGMRETGDILWDISDLSGWTTDTVNGQAGKHWIRITRTANSLSTPPTEDLVQKAETVEFFWDKDGDISAKSVTASDLNTNTAVVTNGSDTLISSATTATEIGYVSGVTSSIQTQLDAKGDVSGPASAGDNAICRFDGTTGKLLQSSSIAIDDSENVTGMRSLTLIDDLAVTHGGTGASTATAAFDALSPTTTKADIIVSDGTNNIRLPIGTDTHVLTADSAQASGVKWAAAGGGSQTPWTSNIDQDTFCIADATNEILCFGDSVASAVNYVEVRPSIATAPVEINALGDDTNIDLDLAGKGTGRPSSPVGQTDNECWGSGTTCNGAASVALGFGARASLSATATGNIAIGENATAGVNAAADDSIAIGRDSNCDFFDSIAIGEAAQCDGYESVVVGRTADAAQQAIAIGAYANAGSTKAVAIGNNVSCGFAGAVCINGSVTGSGGVSIGNTSSAAADATAVGGDADCTSSSVCIGSNADSTGISIVIGRNVTNSTSGQIVMGFSGFTKEMHIPGGEFANSTNTSKLFFTAQSGTDKEGTDGYIITGRGTGTGIGGDLLFQTGDAGTTGTTVNTPTTKMMLKAATGVFHLVPQATAPATCAIGDFYSDTSGAACACTAANTWSNMTATGTCA